MQLLKHHITATLLQALLVIFAFASCIDYDDVADGTTNWATDKEYYLYLTFESTSDWSQTRASVTDGTSAGSGDFVHGNKDTEQAIDLTSSFIIFFDKDGNLFSNPIQDLADGIWVDEEDDEYLTDESREEEEDKNYLEAGYKTRIYPARDDKGNIKTGDDGKPIWPRQCLLVLNGPEADKLKERIKNKDQGFTTVDGILGQAWSWDKEYPKKIGHNQKGYFTMTNTVYVADGKVCAATLIDETKHIKPAEERKKIDKKDMLRIRVERMSAKFTFKEKKKELAENTEVDNGEASEKVYYTLPNNGNTSDEQVLLYDGYYSESGDKDPDDPDDPGNLRTRDITALCRIQVTGWGINALETESHIFKNIGDEGYFYGWNSPPYYRSYWSEDPHYGGSYPWQYRYAVDDKSISYYSYEDKKPEVNYSYKSPLVNYSYKDFYEASIGDGYGRTVYAPENTYDYNELYGDHDNRAKWLAGTHLIVCAELLVDEGVINSEKNEEDGSMIITPEGKYRGINLYRDRIGVYYTKQVDCLAELVRQFNHALKTQSTMKFYYYDWVNRGIHVETDDGKKFTAKCTGDYQLYYDGKPLTPSKVRELVDVSGDIGLCTAEIKDGDGKLLPWTEDLINNLTIQNSKGELLEIYDGDYDLAEEELKEHNNTYNKDKKDFKYQELKKPVRESATTNDIKSLLLEWVGAIDHFYLGQMYYAAAVQHNASDQTADQTELGNYGVVRNHWYKFTLNDILHIGTPVSVPYEQIVPNRVKTNDQLNLKVEIIDWHKIGTTVPIL